MPAGMSGMNGKTRMFYVVSYINLAEKMQWKLPRHDNMTVALICDSPCLNEDGVPVTEGVCRTTETHEVRAEGSYSTFAAAREALLKLFVWQAIDSVCTHASAAAHSFHCVHDALPTHPLNLLEIGTTCAGPTTAPTPTIC